MSIGENLSSWAGKTVVDFDQEKGIDDPAGTLYRLRVEYDADHSWVDLLARLLADPKVGEVTGLVVGNWDPELEELDSTDVVEALSGAADRLPKLTTLFFGDITYEENEISWIQQTDLSPLFNAFPNLEHFGVRGATNLSLGKPHLPHLKTLVIESGGLPRAVVHEVIAAELPSLEHLELWLGSANYGADTSIEDLEPIFDGGNKWPKLTYLGLRDSEITDEIAIALATSPILKQLKVLDLSLGTLGNEGAEALVASPDVARLEKLDIHHHFVEIAEVVNLEALGITVDASDTQKPYESQHREPYRFVAHGE